jgi:CRP-like cAMP-binding protein
MNKLIQPAVIKYNKDAVVLMEGEENPGFIFIVKTGKLKIESKIKFKNIDMNYYSEGDVFGFVSAILKQPHAHNLITLTECELFKLTVGQFLIFIRQRTDTFIKFLSYYTEKLRLLLDENKNFTKIGFTEPSPEQLIINAKIYKELGLDDKACFSLKKYIEKDFSIKKRSEKLENAKSMLIEYNSSYEYPEVKITDNQSSFYEDGQIIFVQNEPEDYMYLIEDGSIVISKIREGMEVMVDTISKGEIFGEMAILNKKSRIATATAKGKTFLKKYTSSDLLTDAGDEVLIKIFYLLAKRFNQANQRILIRKVDDHNVKFYLQINLLLFEKLKPGMLKKEEIAIDYTLEQIGNMVGVQTIEKDKISELIKDKSIKFTESSIVITNADDFENKIGIMKNRLNKIMKEMLI